MMDYFQLVEAFRILCYGSEKQVKDTKHTLSDEFARQSVPSTETKRFFNTMDNFYIGLDKINPNVNDLLDTYVPCIITKKGKKMIGFVAREEAEKSPDMEYIIGENSEISDLFRDFPVISLNFSDSDYFEPNGNGEEISLESSTKNYLNLKDGRWRDNPDKSSHNNNVGEKAVDLYKLSILMGVDPKKRRIWIEQQPENKNNIDEIAEELSKIKEHKQPNYSSI